jgi:hypothetical protein
MWPKEMFEMKRKSDKISIDDLKRFISRKSASYLDDYLENREVTVDKRRESKYW